MRKRRRNPRARVRRLVTRRHADQEDIELFEERDPEVDGCGDVKVMTPDK